MSSPRPAFAVLGTTDDVTTCELCGREDLRGTTALEVLDADGNGTGELLHYGSDCGARAAGWTAAEMGRRTRTAAREAAEAAARARNDAHRDAEAAYAAHLLAVCGSSDREVAHRLRGFASPFAMWKADRAAGAPGTTR